MTDEVIEASKAVVCGTFLCTGAIVGVQMLGLEVPVRFAVVGRTPPMCIVVASRAHASTSSQNTRSRIESIGAHSVPFVPSYSLAKQSVRSSYLDRFVHPVATQ